MIELFEVGAGRMYRGQWPKIRLDRARLGIVVSPLDEGIMPQSTA